MRFTAIAAAAALAAVFGIFAIGSGSGAPQEAAPQLPPLSEQPAMMVGSGECVLCHQQAHEAWTSSRHSKMVQPAVPGAVRGDFSVERLTLRGEDYRVRRVGSQYFITESFFTGEPTEHRVDYTLGNRRIQHYLATLEDGRVIVPAAELGCPAAGVVPQPGDRRPGPAPGDHPGPALEQELFRLPCERPGQGIPPGGGPLRHHLARLRHHLRALSRTRQPPCGQVQEPGGVRRGSRAPHRPADPPRPRAELDGLRPVPLLPRPDGLRLRRRGRLLRLLLPAARIHAGTLRGPDLVTPTARPAVSRRTRSASGRASASCSGGATCTGCHTDPHRPDIERNETGSSRRTTPSAPAATKRSGRTSPPHTFHAGDSAGSACVECHMPRSVTSIRAKMRDHSISIPLTGEHRPFRGPERLQRVPRGGEPGVGRRRAWTSGGETPRAAGRSSAARRPTRGLGS